MTHATRLIWLLVDGLSWRLVELRAGKRTHSTLTRSLRAHAPRRAIPLAPLAPNCQTPPSLFSIFSGVNAQRHGLTGYLLPAPLPGDPLRVVNTFAVWPRDIPMIWDRWAEAQTRFRLCAIPFTQPDRLGEALLGQTRVYEGLTVSPEVISNGERLSMLPLGLDFLVEARQDGVMLQGVSPDGAISQWIALDRTEHLPISAHVRHGNAFPAVAVRAVRIEGEIKLISFGYCTVDARGLPDEIGTSATAPRAYIIGDPAQLYKDNRLGRRLDDGGDGNAERLLLTLMREVHNSFAADIIAAVRADDAECVIGYYPVIDLLSHHLLKYLDPCRAELPASGICEVLFDMALDWVDELIDHCVAAAPQSVRCIAHSDHGMTPVHDDLFPNSFFEQSGWLTYDENGRPDLAASAALFHPAENGLVLFNESRLSKQGIDPDIVTARWRAALPPRLRDGWNMFDGIDTTPPAHGWSARHYWQAPPGTRLRTARSAHLLQPSRKGGDHAVWSNNAWLQGILVDVGSDSVSLPDQAALALPDIAALVSQPFINHLSERHPVRWQEKI
ncbi:hypothetical protein JOE11_004479 [Robbsia andropogonis]|uniref:alkaline phosphatase family protein n=1 Tax=Robbsia andropogonis TaxID=28092 RepID=UPI0020A09407|nr:alkaline phosphatase family protein [Robbsia andropogonis]MCP1120867.1 alkaline phosphatase family protein [Robbsia andropogonis]MCP1130671.1 alkaline phosphatase family protein [Robbsia andropogonis]